MAGTKRRKNRCSKCRRLTKNHPGKYGPDCELEPVEVIEGESQISESEVEENPVEEPREEEVEPPQEEKEAEGAEGGSEEIPQRRKHNSGSKAS